jgi:chromosome segregation ATPase
MVLKD